MYPLNLTTRDIAVLILPGDKFILVDQDEYGSEIAARCRTIPFLERDEQYLRTASGRCYRYWRTRAAVPIRSWPPDTL